MERVRIFPIIALAVVVVIGVILYLVSAKGRKPDPAPEPAPRPQPKGAVDAPPQTNDPGSKILEGADGAFRAGQFPTALKFYKDFELRYAGTEVWERNLNLVWERLHTSNASSPKDKQEPGLAAYIDARRKLADEWKRVKPLVDATPTTESRAEVEKFLNSLPPMDGRRKIIDAWRDRK